MSPSSPAQPSDSGLLWLVQATKAVAISALAFQVLEFFNHITEEVEYLWSGRIRLISYLYAWCRYFPLFAQIINFILSEIIHNPQVRPTPKMCITAFTMKAVTAQLTTTCVESILVVRVHALYNCSRRSGLFLLGILVIGTCLELSGTTLTMRRLSPGAGGSICIPARSSMGTISLFITGCGIIETTLFIMTFTKIMLSRETGWLRTPVISLMLRDSVSIFVLLCVAVSTVIGFEIVRSMDNRVNLWSAAFSWYVALLSVSGCRIILNMRKLGANIVARRQRGFRSLSVSSPDFGIRSPSNPNSASYQSERNGEEGRERHTSSLTQFSTIIDLSD